MVAAANIRPGDTILEIGPGLGALTQELILTGAKIIAQEKDRDLVAVLREQFKDAKNLEIIEGDARHDLSLYNNYKNYKIIANLPYYLTAPVIRQFLEANNPPELMVFLIQKQVGQRICAKPPRMNLLAVSIQVYATPKIISYVSQKCFWPEPEVDGTIIKITPHHERTGAATNRESFFKIVKAGFSHPRKILISNLCISLGINKNDLEKIFATLAIPLKSRAENLAVGDWIGLLEVKRKLDRSNG